MTSITLRTLFAAWIATLVGCSSGPAKIIADAPLEVLERPSPLDYPSTNPIPNAILLRVAAGDQLVVSEKAYEKDFMYYRVKLPGGRTGYVIARAGTFHEVR